MAATNSTMIQVLNSDAQLAWLPPDVAEKYASQLYAGVGALAVLVWDIFLHIPQEYKMLKTCRINFLAISYFLGRLSILTYLICFVVVNTLPIGNCNIVRYITFIFPLTLPITMLHFVFRVSALYHNNKYVLAFFILTWLSVFTTSMIFPFTVRGTKLGPTKYCLQTTDFQLATTIPVLCLFVHDTLIFLTTSWAFLMRSYSNDNGNDNLQFMFLGRRLPKFTRSFLRDGQAYYLASLVPHALFLSQCFAQTPFVYPCTIGLPSFVLTATMSAHVYRNIRLRFYSDDSDSVSIPGFTTNNSSHGSQVLPVFFTKSSEIGHEGSRKRAVLEGHQEKQSHGVVNINMAPLTEVERKTDV